MIPGTTTNTGFISKIIAFLKGSPVFAILSSLFLLALILPPRKRKYKPSRRKRSGNPGKKKAAPKKKKGRKAKKAAKKQARKRTPGRRRSTTGHLPPWRIKGSPEAIARMKRLRGMRKK